MGTNGIMRRCIVKDEREEIMRDAHEGFVGGHYAGKTTPHKIMCIGIWWLKIFQDTKDYCNTCDVCQWVGKPYRRDEIPLNP